MKKILLLSIITFGMLLNTYAKPASKTVRLKVIETSDVHGHFFPYDFMEKKPIKGTLVRANTYINKQRQQYGDNFLLIDNGDILQGQPCVYWSNYVMPEDENLAASVMRPLATTISNQAIRFMTSGSVRCAVRCWVRISSRKNTRMLTQLSLIISIMGFTPTLSTIRMA